MLSAFMASMQSQGRSYFINAVQGDLILDCLFDMADFSLFANPIFWKKQQLEDEEQQMNFMGNILPPFFETNRFKITFVPQTTPHRHNPRLTISGMVTWFVDWVAPGACIHGVHVECALMGHGVPIVCSKVGTPGRVTNDRVIHATSCAGCSYHVTWVAISDVYIIT